MLLLTKLNEPSTWLLLGVAVVAGILLLRTNRYYARQRQQQPSAPGPTTAAPQSARCHVETPAGMARWEVAMHDTARELSAQLDSKLSALQALVAEADRAAARLEAALASAAAPARPPSHQAESLQHAGGSDRDPATAAPRTRRQEEVYTLADYGYDAAEISRRLGTPIGEVELILGLRQQAGGTGRAD